MWFLDLRALDHVFTYIKCFSNIQIIDLIHINSPNGKTLIANFSGTIILDPRLHLYNGLYIPEFHFNLISIFKLCQNLKYKINFSHKSYHIQDESTKRTIGYTHSFFNSTCSSNLDCINDVTSHKNLDIWHHRLVHPSNEVLQHMSHSFPFIKYHKNLLCHVCHLAIQCRLSFSTSNYVISHYFELEHINIWGPINVYSLDGFQYFITIVDDFTHYTLTYLMH